MRWLLAIVLVIAAPAIAIACMWDSDTLKQERARFPDALELITGKFLRHSKDFYRWRISDRETKLAQAPTDPALLDDLAVAYAKIGDTQTAIATMQRADQTRYETAANLGTFRVMAGDYDGGLVDIDRALAINPEAHFGRERYQKWLVEYVQSRMVDDHHLELPLRDAKSPHSSFYDYDMAKAHAATPEQKAAELSRAVTGVLGMMRFADYQNPVLLEALGDLLVHGGVPDYDDAKQLAARAYLRAAAGVEGDGPKQLYKAAATRALRYQVVEGTEDQEPFEQAEAELGSEMLESDEWYAAVRARELGWIKSGANPEAEFDKLYATEPAVIATMNAHDAKIPRWHWIIYGGLVGVSVLVMILIAKRFRSVSAR